jgi:glycosyltransferase involved in cell wall biosynthesis
MEISKLEFSVLMPVYNKDNHVFFEKALHSVFTDQTVKPNEIVIVVDGPVGKDLQLIIDKWKNLKNGLVTICQLPNNLGLGKALQIGLKACKFDLVARMDSDDIAHHDRFEVQLSCFATNPALVVCGSNILEFIDDFDADTSERNLPESSVDIAKFALYRNPINHPSVMFKREEVIAVGGYLDMPYFEDYYLWIRCIMAEFSFYNVQQNLVYMRGGKPQLLRRSGLSYAKLEYKFLNRIRKIGFLKLRLFILLVLARCSIRLVPVFLLKKIYSVLRK